MASYGSEKPIVYSRRRWPEDEKPEEEDGSQSIRDNPISRRNPENFNEKKQFCQSWINRSLSARGRRSSMIYIPTFSSSVTEAKSSAQNQNKAKPELRSPKVHRKKRVEAPEGFVEERKAYFADVDAFELEEETPPKADKWADSLKIQKGGALQTLACNIGLEAVQEEESYEGKLEDTPRDALSINGDPLSAILTTPFLSGKIRSSESLQEPSKKLWLNASGFSSLLAREAEGSCNQPKAKTKYKETIATYRSSSDEETQPSLDVDSANLECSSQLNDSLSEANNAGYKEEGEQLEANLRKLSIQEKKASFRQSLRILEEAEDNNEILQKFSPHARGGLGENSECGSELNGSRLEANDASYKEEGEQLEANLSKLSIQEKESFSPLRTLEEGENSNETRHARGELDALLTECGQLEPMSLHDAISEFCNPEHIVKIGEGTYGEAFKGDGHVFKIVPMGGEHIVNGEVQKTCEEIYSEALVTLALNKLRCTKDQTRVQPNSCSYFIETKALKVCKGGYDSDLVHAWEEWDTDFSSENDNPKSFPQNQLYILFVLADGGKDLEGFSVSSFNEARSILAQVTTALAIAEESCEFEHRDLHWGNILIARKKASESHCKLHGEDISIQTYGIAVQIIDFTLARLHTGTEVLYCNLSADPDIFKGPNRDVQAETYRRMLKLTDGQWEGRFFKTNCFWIHYLAAILLKKKALKFSSKEERELRAFGKRSLENESAQAIMHDGLFSDILVQRKNGPI